jgi:3D (Asp-Asp-Asp) domain-containing protein
MHDEHEQTPAADTSAATMDFGPEASHEPQGPAAGTHLRGWRLVASVAALAAAGVMAWVWLFDAWPDREAAPGARVSFTATAYCKGTTTAAGTAVRRGVAAADRDVLPSGSVVSLSTGDAEFDGVYTVLDTGPAVQGHVLDLYVWSCNEALAFGRRTVTATILRLGWDPRDSAPTMTDRLLHRKPRRYEPEPEETAAQPEKVPPPRTRAADPPAEAPPPDAGLSPHPIEEPVVDSAPLPFEQDGEPAP